MPEHGHQDDTTPPRIAIGHVELAVTDVATATDFFLKLGLRHIYQEHDFAVLELRGGTHLVLEADEGVTPLGTTPTFDLMVEDIESMRTRCAEGGMNPTPLKSGQVHSSFEIKGPDDYTVTITSSHAADRAI